MTLYEIRVCNAESQIVYSAIFDMCCLELYFSLFSF